MHDGAVRSAAGLPQKAEGGWVPAVHPATVGRRVLASMARRGFTASAGPESPRYYAPSPYGVVRPHHLGVFVTLRAGMISLPGR